MARGAAGQVTRYAAASRDVAGAAGGHRHYGGQMDDMGGRVAWVTGGASGIGWATVARLVEAGAVVGILGREDQSGKHRQ